MLKFFKTIFHKEYNQIMDYFFDVNKFFNRKIFDYLIILFLLAICALPQIMTLIKLSPFHFENAFDEYWYFSYQGALATQKSLAYGYSFINIFLQKIGISGAQQLLLLFFILIPLMWAMIRFSLLAKGIKKDRVTLCIFFILFGSVLFNCANPFLRSIFIHNENAYTFLVYGFEDYPALFRLPNPLISYFLITLALFLYIKLKQKYFIILLCPLPFLYFFCAQVYSFFILVFFMIHYFYKTFNAKSILISCSFAYFILSAFLFLGHYFASSHFLFILESGGFKNIAYVRYPVFPIGSLFLLIEYGVLIYLNNKKTYETAKNALLLLFVSSLLISNTHVLTGFSVSNFKDLQDYGICILASIGVAIFLYHIQLKAMPSYLKNNLIFLQYSLIFLMLAWIYNSQKMYYQINNAMGSIPENIVARIKADPMHAIILDQQLAEYITFSEPKMIAPITSWVYKYSFANTSCEFFDKYLNGAISYIDREQYSKKMMQELGGGPIKDSFQLNINILKQSLSSLYSLRKHLKMNHYDYCDQIKNDNSFFIVANAHGTYKILDDI